MIRLIILLAITAILFCCSDADTLGDEPPVEVVIQGAPTWENGIRELAVLKCGYCHGFPLPELAPDNIVPDLDLNQYDTRQEGGLVVRGGDAIGRWIFEGILDHPVEKFLTEYPHPRQMPLSYGTPLTGREKTYLEAWSNAGSPRNNNPQPPLGDPSSGQQQFDIFCSVCHGANGEGFPLGNGLYQGPDLRPEAVTVEKIKSMWLHKLRGEPLSTEEASNIRAYILELLNR